MRASFLGSIGGSIPPCLLFVIAAAIMFYLFFQKNYETGFYLCFLWLGKLHFQLWTFSLFENCLSAPQLLGLVIVLYGFLKTAFCTEEKSALPQGLPPKPISGISLQCNESLDYPEDFDTRPQNLLPSTPIPGTKLANDLLSLETKGSLADIPLEEKLESSQEVETFPEIVPPFVDIELLEQFGASPEMLPVIERLVAQTVRKFLFK